MEPRLRFARTEDNTALAFWAFGEGPALVHMPLLPWSHVQSEWQNSEMRRWFDTVGHNRTLVRYDGRGTGLADRTDPDFGIDAQVEDLEAVVDTLELQRFILLGAFHSGPAAILYAVRHPDRVAGLILWSTYARGEDYYASPRVNAIRELLNDWELYTETGAHVFVGWLQSDAAHEMAALMREASTADLTRQFFTAMRPVDCTDLLAEVSVPTLVMHPRDFPIIDAELARGLAVGIEDSRLVLVNGDSLAPTRGDTPAVMHAIEDFINQLDLEDELAEGTQDGPGSAHKLSKRELEILALVATGKSNREVAEVLVLSPRTVERHVENIFAKLNVHNRSQATAYAVSNGIEYSGE